ncbi:hypothetical protein [Ralstonia pickettii]|uniref:hypothetical protein n=2 Tax=Ralstonia pickettii TaxID=329 RepID=UPI002D7A1E75|nr:hypothetical protein [Ralstonia pickettii]
MKKFFNRLLGSDGKYEGVEYCDTCSGSPTKWSMRLEGDRVFFYEKDKTDFQFHEFSKAELEANDCHFYFYEDKGNFIQSSINQPESKRHEKVKILFGVNEIRILAENRNIVFNKSLLGSLFV